MMKFVETRSLMRFWVSRWSAARLVASNLKYQVESRYSGSSFWVAFWVSVAVNSLVQAPVLSGYPVPIKRLVEGFSDGRSDVICFAGLLQSHGGCLSVSPGYDLGEALLQRVYGSKVLADLRSRAPAFSLPQSLVLAAVPNTIVQDPVTPRGAIVAPTLPLLVLPSGRFPPVDPRLSIQDSTKVVLSALVEAYPRLDNQTAGLLVSSWAAEVFGIMTKSLRDKFLRDPLARNFADEAFSSRENLAQVLKVSHFYRL